MEGLRERVVKVKRGENGGRADHKQYTYTGVHHSLPLFLDLEIFRFKIGVIPFHTSGYST